MANDIKYKRLTKLQKALLWVMSEQDLTPKSPTRKCYHIIMDFIGRYGNYFCDSIHEIQQSLYALSHEREFKVPYVEAHGFTGELVEDSKGNVSYTDGANMRYVECRLTQSGLGYVRNHKSLSQHSNPLVLLIGITPIVEIQKRQRVKPTKLSDLQEVLLLHMAKQGYWPGKPFRKSFNIVDDFIKNNGDYYTDSISSVMDALYDMSHDWMFDIPLIEAQGNTGHFIESYNNIIVEEVGANCVFTEARLSRRGIDYVIENNLINKYLSSNIRFPLWG